MPANDTHFESLRKIASTHRLPSALVDLDAFDRNIDKAAALVRGSGKTLRLATKSLRVPQLIQRALDRSNGVFRGLMCYSAEEARFLRARGFDDFLIAYPTLQISDLEILREIHDSGGKITITVDHPAHIRALAEAMKGCARPFPLLLDIDVSLRLFGGLLHLGVRRSRLRSAADALRLQEVIARNPQLKAIGLMAYEAQVAGLTDRNPFKKLINPIAGLIRKLSIPRVARLRAEIAQSLRSAGVDVALVNGAGTGSLDIALKESALTEVTIGSGLLCSHLFDYYSNLRFEPACYFALQVTRASDPGYVTCSGGGYIASGEPGWDRVPVPVHPSGLKLVGTEGCGEVQTPLQLTVGSPAPELGSAVLFRHAKAGELAEHFGEYLLISNGKIVARAPTYRGLGECYL